MSKRTIQDTEENMMRQQFIDIESIGLSSVSHVSIWIDGDSSLDYEEGPASIAIHDKMKAKVRFLHYFTPLTLLFGAVEWGIAVCLLMAQTSTKVFAVLISVSDEGG